MNIQGVNVVVIGHDLKEPVIPEMRNCSNWEFYKKRKNLCIVLDKLNKISKADQTKILRKSIDTLDSDVRETLMMTDADSMNEARVALGILDYLKVDSISEYYGHGITCEKNENGFFELNCISSLCNNCEVKPMFTDSDFTIPDLVRFHQFVLDKYSYVNKKGETKEGKRTVKKEFEETFQDFKSGFDSKSAVYLLHRYEIKND